MQYLAMLWWAIKNWRGFVRIYREGQDVVTEIKEALEDKKVTKAEYEEILNQVLELVEALKFKGGK